MTSCAVGRPLRGPTAAACGQRIPGKLSRQEVHPAELPDLPSAFPNDINGPGRQRSNEDQSSTPGQRKRRPTIARARTPKAGCRPPATWDHREVSSARSMGPPVRQLWDDPGSASSGCALPVYVRTGQRIGEGSDSVPGSLGARDSGGTVAGIREQAVRGPMRTQAARFAPFRPYGG